MLNLFKSKHSIILACSIAALSLTGCVSETLNKQPSVNHNLSQQATQQDWVKQGRIITVEAFKHETQGSFLGMGIGALAGGVVGNQIGGGSGKTLATIAGVAGGAYAGNKLDPNNTNITYTQKATIELLDTHQQITVDQPMTDPHLKSGDLVNVINKNGSLSFIK